MKTQFQIAAIALLALGTSAIARDVGPTDPVGTWLVEDGRAKVHIEKCGADHADLCGNVVWLKDPNDEKGRAKLDVHNPDPTKRSRSAVGMPLFDSLKPDEDQIYSGQIYNAENGKNYDVTLKVEKPSELRLKGCVMSILCQSQHWTRVSDVSSTVVATSQKVKPKAGAPAE